MQIRSANKYLTFSLVALALSALLGVGMTAYYREAQTRMLEVQQESMKLTFRLEAGSGKLTSAARAFAATGEARYEKDYSHDINVERTTDNALAGLRALPISISELNLIEEVKRHLEALMHLENQAFDAGHAKKLTQALELLYGQAYLQTEANVFHSIQQIRKDIHQRLATEIGRTKKQADTALNISIILLILSIVMVLWMQLLFYRNKVLAPLVRLNHEVNGLLSMKDGSELSALDIDSEIGNLARSIASYHQIARQTSAQSDARKRVAEVALDLRQADSLPELANKLMHHLGVMLDVRHGLFYITDEHEQRLKLVGGYGVASGDIGKEVAFGEGLVGQCAIEQKPIRMDKPPADYIQITSGTGSASPACILIRPLVLNEHLVGVLEVAAFRAFDDKDQAFLAELEPTLAMSAEILERQQTVENEYVLQQALVDTIPYPIFYKGPDARFLGFNRAYEEAFAVKRENIIGKLVLDLEFLSEEDRLAYHEEDQRVISEGISVQRERLIPFADGKIHSTQYFVSGFRRADGSPGGLIGTFIDISDRK